MADIMLTSEHRRILASAQERYDEKLNEQHRLGFWRGLAYTAWLTFVGASGGLLLGFVGGLYWQ
jgi:ABC-type amino acid transport system permease subunit